MNNYRSSPGPVPDRWLHCPRKADELIVQKIMAFKTPLSSKYDDDVPPQFRFPPSMIFDICRRKKVSNCNLTNCIFQLFFFNLQLKLGLWIDLTNTSRFYDKKDIESQGCKYLKLQCRGHGECPSVEHTKLFINCVHEFISKHPLEIIGVHCTHGFNRTGFLIVSYLVEKCDCGLEVALDMFARARLIFLLFRCKSYTNFVN